MFSRGFEVQRQLVLHLFWLDSKLLRVLAQ